MQSDHRNKQQNIPMPVPQPFSQIRMVVNATNTSSIFWTMSEFKFYSVSVTDPEAADE